MVFYWLLIVYRFVRVCFTHMEKGHRINPFGVSCHWAGMTVYSLIPAKDTKSWFTRSHPKARFNWVGYIVRQINGTEDVIYCTTNQWYWGCNILYDKSEVLRMYCTTNQLYWGCIERQIRGTEVEYIVRQISGTEDLLYDKSVVLRM